MINHLICGGGEKELCFERYEFFKFLGIFFEFYDFISNFYGFILIKKI